MVRFKNRWLLVEFIFPSSQPVPAALALTSGSSSASGSAQNASDASSKAKGKRRSNGQPSSKRKKKSKSTASSDDSSSDEDEDEQSDHLDDPHPSLSSSHPLLLPPPPTSGGQTRVLGEKQIHAAVKASVVQAFGDDGWAKIASNTNVKYYSSQTQTAIIRTSRDHYRIVQAALACLGPVNNERVIANVLHISGTIKKIQLRQVTHNRLLVATIIAALKLPCGKDEKLLSLPAPSFPADDGSSKDEGGEEAKWKRWEEKERVIVEGLLD